MPRAGTSLERLVASLEKALAQDKGVTVESPKRLPDRTTSSLREHDVVLTIAQGHHSLRIAIECRDRSRPITVNQVEGFWAKCQDTGIDQGIIVSSTGFYKTARTKASHLGIRCLDIEEVESFDWLAAPGVELMRSHIIHTAWTFYPEKDGVVDRASFQILDSAGNTISTSALTNIARNNLRKVLPEPPEPIDEKDVTIRFDVHGNELMLRDVKSGAKVPVKYVILEIKYSVKAELLPFTLMHYVDKDGDKSIADCAVVQLDLGEQSGRWMIVVEQGKGGKVLYVTDPKRQASRPD